MAVSSELHGVHVLPPPDLLVVLGDQGVADAAVLGAHLLGINLGRVLGYVRGYRSYMCQFLCKPRLVAAGAFEVTEESCLCERSRGVDIVKCV